MPTYDFMCSVCGRSWERFVWLRERDSQVCQCGEPANRIWKGAPAMRPDSIPGGVVIENLTAHPKRYYSHTEIKDQMRATGSEQRVRHVGTPGSDKSPHTTRWS